MHMVVATPRPWILRKLSTCMPQASEVSPLASMLHSAGKRATPSKMTASTRTVS